MKANLPKIKDATLKQQAQLDADLWESMVQHMEGMVKMMSERPGMGMMGGMHHRGMMGGMQNMPPKSDTAPAPPPEKSDKQ
jgi:hypothetical protein